MGKSTLAYCLARQQGVTRIVIDPRSQYHTSETIIPDSSQLFELLDDRWEVIVQPGRAASLQESFDSACDAVADWIEENPGENICLLVDEGRLVGLDQKNVSPSFDWILRSAREGSPISVIITCHRPADVSTNIRAIANKLVFFRVMLPNDLAAIEDQCGPVVTEEVSRLEDRHFVTWNNSRQQWRKNDSPQSWKIEIERKDVPLGESASVTA